MTDDPQILMTPEIVLESAVDSEKLTPSEPSGSDVLMSVANLPVSSDQFKATVKSTEILQPDQPIELPKAITEKANDLFSGKLFESIASPVTNFIENISNITNNYLGKNSEVITNSEKLTSQSITELIKENEQSFSDILTNNIRETGRVLENSSTIISDINSSVETNRESVKQKLEKINSSINSSIVSNSSILEKISGSSDKESSKENAFLSSTESSILELFKQGEAQTANETPQVNQSTSNSSNLSVKNNKLIESSEVKNILAPDKTLEKSVSVLSRALPEAVNNLSTSFTSISPNSSTNNSNFTEGTRIDQSTSTVINQMTGQQKPQAQTADSNTPDQNQAQNTEYYLQAIYSALMSGKIRVKLETY